MSLKGANSPTRGRKLRSTGTKTSTRVGRMREPRADLQQQLEQYRRELGEARSAMWLSVVAMSLPNVLLFSLAWTMVSNVFDAGQGIGVIEAMLILPIIAMIWPGPPPSIFDNGPGASAAAA